MHNILSFKLYLTYADDAVDKQFHQNPGHFHLQNDIHNNIQVVRGRSKNSQITPGKKWLVQQWRWALLEIFSLPYRCNLTSLVVRINQLIKAAN